MPAAPDAVEGTVELGLDVIRVARIREAIDRYGDRFTRRVLTPAEASYVRGRPETLAGRWAAKEAVSKVLGLGVRGIGWRDIEIERLPTGQPAVVLHGRAAERGAQLGIGHIALSITHEREYALAVAHAVRTAGGRFVLPVDLERRLDEREAALLRRMARLRALERATRGRDEAAAGAVAAEPTEGTGHHGPDGAADA